MRARCECAVRVRGAKSACVRARCAVRDWARECERGRAVRVVRLGARVWTWARDACGVRTRGCVVCASADTMKHPLRSRRRDNEQNIGSQRRLQMTEDRLRHPIGPNRVQVDSVARKRVGLEAGISVRIDALDL